MDIETLLKSPYDGAPLGRAIAFTKTIEDSKKVSQQFEEVVNEYIGADIEEQSKKLSMRHADGKMNALQKGEVLDWLADPNKLSDEARIVSNVRFLTEGVDVPTLDAVIFLAPKNLKWILFKQLVVSCVNQKIKIMVISYYQLLSQLVKTRNDFR